MRNFDGNDPKTCIFQMEQYIDLHPVASLQKVNIASMFLEHDQNVWHQWIFISCSIFIEELIAHYGDIKRNTFINQFIIFCKKGLVT